ncbi:hypothetical protein N657DRAFT_109914 [Parathielavia appendiculata]|uniref:Uncharacterized protein n=1 Tax=Parathielavia appendiculata TaxID=2587402 RepID=A0AAN6TVT3_9PEZI|nr:hypothetical protein N657DRAFT_109914 [Parathielavia appendiculata]
MAGSKRKAPDDADPGTQQSLTLDEPDPSIRPTPGRPRPPSPGRAADGYFRQLYESEPDFNQLAKQDSRFAAPPEQWAARLHRPSSHHATDKDLVGS